MKFGEGHMGNDPGKVGGGRAWLHYIYIMSKYEILKNIQKEIHGS